MISPRSKIVHASDPKEVVDAIRAAGRRVMTFSGFSGGGYEDPAYIHDLMTDLLMRLDNRSVVVCSGATAEGIGAVYPIARAGGFMTVGIVSAVAESEGARFSDDVDTIYVIEDEDWGGRRKDGTLSPTSTAMVEAAHEVVVIGGGSITRDEIEAALTAKKPVRYFAADMNHSTALVKAAQRGESAPKNFAGPVHRMFNPDPESPD